jgi:predicted ribosome quality control (RQC) complex YloA/Tae2 family protein
VKRRETLSALDVFVLARELNTALKGAFVDKVHQLGPDDVLLKVNARHGIGRATVLLLGGRRVHLTQRTIEVPERPSNFAMAARRRLANSTVEAVEQVGFDRIVRMRFARADENFELIIEMLPDGAVALIEAGLIAVVAKPKLFKERKVLPKQPYVGPRAGPDPRSLGAEGMAKAAGVAGMDLGRALATRAGLGPGLAAEALARAGLEEKRDPASLSGAQWSLVAQAFEEILREAEVSALPVALLEGEAMVDFAPIAQKRWGASPTRTFPSVSELLDAYFEAPSAPKAPKASEEATRESDDNLARLVRVEVQQQRAVADLEREVTAALGGAEAVYANYPQVEMFLRLAKPGGSARQLSDLVRRAGLEFAAPEVAPSLKAILVDLKTPDGTSHRVEVEVGASVNEVAQGYYRAATRAKGRMKGAQGALEETQAAIEAARRKQARQGRVAAAQAQDAAERSGPLIPPISKRRDWFERFRWFLSTEGDLVVGGRDATTNDQLVKKYLKAGDRYAHADIHGAPSVVVKRAEGKDEIGEATLAEACAFAAIMSRAWHSGAAEASSFWVTPDQVSKTPESGEALGRGAFVIRGKRNTVRHVALRAAVGGLTVKGERKAMCGPPEAVAAHCDAAFLIAPGPTKATDVAKQLAAKIRVHPDEIARSLPPGTLEVQGPLETGARAARGGEED